MQLVGPRNGTCRQYQNNCHHHSEIPLYRQHDKEDQQQKLAKMVIEEGISVRKLEEISQSPQINKTNPQKQKKQKENKYSYLQEELSEKLGTKVVIKSNKIEISFSGDTDLSRLLEVLNIEVDR